MSKAFPLVVLCFTLSGCVLYAPTYIHETVVQVTATSTVDDHSAVRTETNEVSERVTQTAPPSSAQRSLAECGPFDLPRADPLPTRPTDEELAAAESSEALDRLIAEYTEELRTYSISDRAKIEQAHQKWLARCERSTR